MNDIVTKRIAGEGNAEVAAQFSAFWEVLEGARAALDARLLSEAEAIEDFRAVLKALTPAQLAQGQQHSRALQEGALVRGEWQPLLDDLDAQGRRYAEQGIRFAAWFQLLTGMRAALRPAFDRLAASDPAKARHAEEGMHRYLDLTMARIGEAYLQAKEVIIRRQQEAIRELSTPVLQVRDRLLIIPVVGMVDTLRARQLTEALLQAIRERRAKTVVMDITGVPIVDSRVANHLVQACEAARLMGAHVVITGISSSIAQALVGIGAELRGVPTLSDLQSGIEEAERVLAGLAPAPREGELTMHLPILRQGRMLILPLPEALTDSGWKTLRDAVLAKVGQSRALGVVIDVSAMDVMDSYATRILDGLAKMVSLRGARGGGGRGLAGGRVRDDPARAAAAVGGDRARSRRGDRPARGALRRPHACPLSCG